MATASLAMHDQALPTDNASFASLLATLATRATTAGPATADATGQLMLEAVVHHYGFTRAVVYALPGGERWPMRRQICWAFPGRADAARGGSDTTVTLHVPVTGRKSYAVTFSTQTIPDGWDRATMTRELCVVTSLLAALLDRRDLAHGRDRQMAFESLLVKLALQLQALTAMDLERALPRVLRSMAEFFQMDRVAIFTHAPLGGWHLASCHASEPSLPHRAEPPARAVHAYLLRLTRGAIITLSQSPDEGPAPTDHERDFLRARELALHTSVPLVSMGRLLGVLTGERTRADAPGDEDEPRRLNIVAELLAAAMARQHADRSHRTQRANLAYVGRVAFMGELSATLLNDFTQPLAGIMSNAQAAQRWLASDRPPLAEARLALTDIVAETMRASTLVRNLRELLKRRYPHKVVIHVSGVINDIDHLIRAIALEHGAEPVIDLAPDLPEIYGDRVQLQHVVLNLVRNAAEAMRGACGADTSLVLKAERWQDTGVLLSVSDGGPPLGEEAAARLFEPFHSTKPDGLGMGLAISRSIVESHEGAIWWVRRPERGLCVYVALPGNPEP